MESWRSVRAVFVFLYLIDVRSSSSRRAADRVLGKGFPSDDTRHAMSITFAVSMLYGASSVVLAEVELFVRGPFHT